MGSNINGEILVISSNPSLIVYSLLNVSNLIYVIDDDHDYASSRVKSLSLSELKKNMFDGIVTDCLQDNPGRSRDIMIKAFPYLRKNGVICSVEKNSRNFFSLNGIVRILRGMFLQNKIRKMYISYSTYGLHLKEFIYTTIYDGFVYESRVEDIYYTNKNTFLWKEKLKKYLSYFRFSLNLSSGFIVVMSKNKLNNTLLDDLKAEAGENSDIVWEGKEITVVKIYYKQGKLLISLSSRKNKIPEYIVIICINTDAVNQRRNEYKTLKVLSEQKNINEFLPKIYGEFNIYGLPYYVVEEFEGLTVDIGNKHLKKMMGSAYSILPLFLLNKKNNYDENRILIRSKVNNYISRMKIRSSFCHENIDALHALMLDKIKDISIPLVVMHGDYKIENVVLNSSDYSVKGLIDLELSDLEGFPLVDLFYLITYGMDIQIGLRFLQAYRCILSNNIDSYYEGLIKDYVSISNLNKHDYEFLLALYLVHHYSERYYFDSSMDVPGEIDLFELALNDTIKLLKGS